MCDCCCRSVQILCVGYVLYRALAGHWIQPINSNPILSNLLNGFCQYSSLIDGRMLYLCLLPSQSNPSRFSWAGWGLGFTFSSSLLPSPFLTSSTAGFLFLLTTTSGEIAQLQRKKQTWCNNHSLVLENYMYNVYVHVSTHVHIHACYMHVHIVARDKVYSIDKIYIHSVLCECNIVPTNQWWCPKKLLP